MADGGNFCDGRFVLAHGIEGDWPKAGQWVRDHPCRDEFRKSHPEIKAFACCPNGHGGSIISHTIFADGVLFPSYVCPGVGCGFHVFVKFDGWTGGEK